MTYSDLAQQSVACGITMDIHNTKGSGNAAEQLSMGYRNIDATRYQIDFAKSRYAGESLVVIGPDSNSLERTRAFAAQLNAGQGVFDKERSKNPNELTEHTRYIGNRLKGRSGLSPDDIADSLGTLKKVLEYCERAQLKNLDMMVTHGILSYPALKRLDEFWERGVFRRFVMTNTVTHERGDDVLQQYRLPERVEIMEVQSAFAEMVYLTHNDFGQNQLLTERR
jgi:ribose-phosphate pyrophosphokinase